MEDIRLSKAITWLLRHGAEKEGLTIDGNGFVSIEQIIDWLGVKNDDRWMTNNDDISDYYEMTHNAFNRIKEIVNSDDKTRFTLKNVDGKFFIRANQGHSITSVVMELTEYNPKNNYVPVIHGTYSDYIPNIISEGLKTMTRNHIHMINIDVPTTEKWKLLRPDINTFIYIDIFKAKLDGIKFWESSNGVILSEGQSGTILPKYLTIITQLNKANCYGFIVHNNGSDDSILTVKTHKGRLGFPKGKKHYGELSLACAYRELYEETSLMPYDIIINKTDSDLSEKGVSYFNANLSLDCKTHIKITNPDELAEVSWLKKSELLSLPNIVFSEDRKKILRNL